MYEALLKTLESFPPFLTTNDLITIGIYASADVAFRTRKFGKGPDYVKMNRLILYPKASLIEYLARHMKKGSND